MSDTNSEFERPTWIPLRRHAEQGMIPGIFRVNGSDYDGVLTAEPRQRRVVAWCCIPRVGQISPDNLLALLDHQASTLFSSWYLDSDSGRLQLHARAFVDPSRADWKSVHSALVSDILRSLADRRIESILRNEDGTPAGRPYHSW